MHLRPSMQALIKLAPPDLVRRLLLRKALRQSIHRVFGKRVIVQRWQLHKMRNVIGHLSKALHASVRQTLREAYANKNDKTAVPRLKQLASSLSEEHPGAAASLKEGLETSKWPRRANRAATESYQAMGRDCTSAGA